MHTPAPAITGRTSTPHHPRRNLLCAAALLPIAALAQGAPIMTRIAKGSFSVQMSPQGEAQSVDGISMARLALSKRFEGDLVASGQGEMLTTRSAVKGSAGYVAMERVSGNLHGRQGSFVLQHSGLMDQGAQQLSIRVVPDSGSGELRGLSGELRIQIVESQHLYEFEYRLP